MQGSRQSASSYRSAGLVLLLAWLQAAIVEADGDCVAAARVLLGPAQISELGPHGITRDPESGTYWVAAGLSTTIYAFGADLVPLEPPSFKATLPALPVPITGNGLRGIAWDEIHRTLWVARLGTPEIWEIELDGTPTGSVLRPELGRPGNGNAPEIRGLAFSREGDGGRGSLWLVNGAVTEIQEITLEGFTLRSFCHPFDPDGCPGEGKAAHAFGIDVVRGPGGATTLELLGRCKDSPCIIGVDFDGNLTGRQIPLGFLGAEAAGFVHTFGPGLDIGNQAIAVVTSSDARVRVIELEGDAVPPPFDLHSTVEVGSSVRLSWMAQGEYDAIEIRREDEPLVTLPGDATGYFDADPPAGTIDYKVAGLRNGCRAESGVAVLVGPGRVLARLPLARVLPDRAGAVDITQDDEGVLWITQQRPSPRIVLVTPDLLTDPDLHEPSEIPAPFGTEEELLTGIAFRPDRRTVLVYDNGSHRVIELDLVGNPIEPPFASGISAEGGDPIDVSGMAYRAEGDEGNGSLVYLLSSAARIEERGLDGHLIASCVHPDFLADPTLAPVGLSPYVGGPAIDFDREGVLIAGGSVRSSGLTRILRVTMGDCVRTAFEVPIEKRDGGGRQRLIGIHAGRLGDQEAIFTVTTSFSSSVLQVLEAGAPKVAPPRELVARQLDVVPDVDLSFIPGLEVDTTEILRDGALIASVDPATDHFIDRDVPSGRHDYRARSRLGDERSEDATASIRVGPGSVRDRALTFPSTLLGIPALRHGSVPEEDEWIVPSTSYSDPDHIHVFNADLREVRTLRSPFVSPFEIAALTVREYPTGDEIYILGWTRGSADDDAEFPIEVIDLNGNKLRRFTVQAPLPPARLLPYPAGLVWDSERDTLWFFEKNGGTLSEYDIRGRRLRSIEQPVRPFDHTVSAPGLARHPRTGTFWVPSAIEGDDKPTRVVELTPSGRPTGIEIVLDVIPTQEITGFSFDRDGTTLLASCMTSGLGELVEYRAFDSIAPVADLACSLHAEEPSAVHLTWSVADVYSSIEVFRGNSLATVLGGNAEEWIDPAPPACGGFWRIVPVRESVRGPGAVCDRPATRAFLRGDAEENGAVNISDAIAILQHLFAGAADPPCFDAADVNDDGIINITDPIRLLGFLFLPDGDPPCSCPTNPSGVHGGLSC